MRTTMAWITMGALVAFVAAAMHDTFAVSLKVDMDESTTHLTKPGFESLTLADNPGEDPAKKTFANGVTIDIDPHGEGTLLGEEFRHAPTDASPTFSSAEIFRDMITARNVQGKLNGLDIIINGLTPKASYQVTIWSFDIAQPRATSDWFVASKLAKDDLVKKDYVSSMTSPPTTDADNRFTFQADVDDKGDLVIRGRSTTTNDFQVIINALSLEERSAKK